MRAKTKTNQRTACRHEANREKRQELARLRHEANHNKQPPFPRPPGPAWAGVAQRSPAPALATAFTWETISILKP